MMEEIVRFEGESNSTTNANAWDEKSQIRKLVATGSFHNIEMHGILIELSPDQSN